MRLHAPQRCEISCLNGRYELPAQPRTLFHLEDPSITPRTTNLHNCLEKI